MPRRSTPVLWLLLATLAAIPLPALASNDTPTVSVVSFGTNKIELEVTAGPSGTPGGFSIYWMTRVDYEDYGSVWPDLITYPGLHWANFSGEPTLNTEDGLFTTFQLGPNQTIRVEIGDLEDETGVTTNTPEELPMLEIYSLCVFANAGGSGGRSGYSLTGEGSTVHKKDECIHSRGYWRNHPEEWPVDNLTLGTVNYTKAQLLQILAQPTQGNGLVSMAKQFIATLLNVANGAVPTPIQSRINSAHALIGNKIIPPIGAGYLSPSSTSSLTQKFDDFNNGKIDTHCDEVTSTVTSSWGRLKSLYR